MICACKSNREHRRKSAQGFPGCVGKPCPEPESGMMMPEPSPPAPPRSEQETDCPEIECGKHAVLMVCPGGATRSEQETAKELWAPILRMGADVVQAVSTLIVFEKEGAARGAAKKERERVLDEVRLSTCFMCADDDEYSDKTEQHHVQNEFRDDYVLCRSKHIRRALKRYRALPPEEGNTDAR